MSGFNSKTGCGMTVISLWDRAMLSRRYIIETINPTFRIFFGIQIIFPQIQSGQSTNASGLAAKIVLAKCQDRQTCRFNSTAYS
jgi:hypothetical protein